MKARSLFKLLPFCVAAGSAAAIPAYFVLSEKGSVPGLGATVVAAILLLLLLRAAALQLISRISGRPKKALVLASAVPLTPVLLVYILYPLGLLQLLEPSFFWRPLLVTMVGLYLGLTIAWGIVFRTGLGKWRYLVALPLALVVAAGIYLDRDSAGGRLPPTPKTGVQRIEQGRLSRQVLAMEWGRALETELTATPGSRLAFQVGTGGGSRGGSGLLKVLTIEAGRTTALLEKTVDFGSDWTTIIVDLAPVAGRPARIYIKVEPLADEGSAEVYITVPRVMPPPDRRPLNVVLLVFDALRADALDHVPGLRDQWAARGIFFERDISASSWTCPAVGALLTSKLPSQNHTLPMLDPRLRTIPYYLGRSGIRTGAVAGNPLLLPFYNFASGFEDFEWLSAAEVAWRNPERLIAKGLAWIAAEPQSPFFLYLHVMDPHHPYLAPWSAAQAGPLTWLEYAADNARLLAPTPRLYRLGQTDRRELSPADLSKLKGRYLDEAAYALAQVQTVEDGLKAMGLWQNTVLIITSDHGEAFQEHGYLRHGQDLYLEQVHVPLVILGGPVESAPARVTRLVSSLDLFPTILEIQGVPLPSDILGRSLWPAARGMAVADRPVFSELRSPAEELMVSIMDGEYHLIRTEFTDGAPARTELYRPADDPAETRDLASQLPQDRDRLAAALRDYLASVPDRNLNTSSEQVLDQMKRQLRALGYTKGK